ncbi:hypothetical protein T310_3188 [Rasamsonia emersonii CBS 393.64]|uniref:Aminoglycoside phosphotransferase domain-containing protein n=1 Tax=Rasamsonia emersonii (strain ATCC 16479 / CBS 393.64 / IMI 116815) TaxID=1408163 RepID=A0A0F4YY69_RASE3|nr:hypothetical protein T310_3188 [Rasamsonia emersonii CBS 393.64]KKA22776.1 hypothetical protein T310_3188 [Rasamsonia emersonii CBS 393.64]
MVDDDGEKITGILDWENSGFFPEYVEHTLAKDVYDYYGEEWWRPVLMEVLEESCRPERPERLLMIWYVFSSGLKQTTAITTIAVYALKEDSIQDKSRKVAEDDLGYLSEL